MCLFKIFKKEKKEKVVGKYQIGQYVHFRYRNELMFGYIYDIKKDYHGQIIYDIQIAGQCPTVVFNIKEEIIFIKK